MSNPYKFEPGTAVQIVSYPGITVNGAVYLMYTSDEFNHPAKPHRRYVVLEANGDIYDVSENELVLRGGAHG